MLVHSCACVSGLVCMLHIVFVFIDNNDDAFDLNEILQDIDDGDRSKYYTLSEFPEQFTKVNSDLLILHLNICSLYPKLDHFSALMSLLECQFDCLCLSETWLTPSTVDLVSINNYQAFHTIRRVRGGGVSIFVRDTFECEKIEELCFQVDDFESVFVKIERNNKILIVGTIYKPPNCMNDIFMSTLETVLNTLSRNRSRYKIVCGDFNFDLFKVNDDNNCSNFLNTFLSNAFIPLITKPTRITDHSYSLIDNIFSTNESFFKSAIIPCDLSDHYIIAAHYPNFFNNNHVNGNKLIKYRSHTSVSINNLCESVSHYDFANIVQCEDVDMGIEKLIDVLMNFYDLHCPIKSRTISYKDDIKPWIDYETKELIRKRQNYFLLYKRNLISRVQYNRYRNRVTAVIRHKRSAYYANKFIKLKGNMGDTWKLINSLFKSGVTRNKIKLVVGDNEVTNVKQVVDHLNNYFCAIGGSITNSFPFNPNSHSSYLSGNYINSFFFTPVTVYDINKVVLSLKNKACQIDVLPVYILKYLSIYISPVLTNLINKSLATGKFPDIFKLARVVPIHKGGNSYAPNNYRPISILNVFSKIYEKIVHNKLMNYLESKNILSQYQYGFRENRSTVQSLLHYLRDVYAALDSGYVYFSLFLDLKKAFDCVSHSILLSKLRFYGIRGVPLDWFSSYLSNRRQYVVVDDVFSEICDISCGVPQGSILGPLLFLVFINDFPGCTDYFKFSLFADDSTLSCRVSKNELDTVHVTINDNLVLVSNWLIANKIMINADKTKYMIFSLRGDLGLRPLLINGSAIQKSNSLKFLGLYLDNNLKFDSHVQILANKISRLIGILYKLSHFLPENILKSIYFTMIHPHFTYAIECWFNAPEYLIKTIDILQKKAVRVIKKVDCTAHTEDLFKNLNLLKLHSLFKYKIGLYTHKSLNMSNFDYVLANYIHSHINQHDYATRNSSLITLPFYHKTKSKSSIIFRACCVWNEISGGLQQIQSFKNFRKLYRESFT